MPSVKTDPRSTLFGRFQTAEPLSVLAEWTHVAQDETLKEVSHPPAVDVLDQEDLLEQDIKVSTFITGATDVDALGSCTMNATTAKLSSLLTPAQFLALPATLAAHGITIPDIQSMEDVVGAEKLAIALYHLVTFLTGTPSSEWPTVDCGSSGPYIVQLLVALKLIKGAKIAHGAQNIASLLQQGSILMGTPWLNAWMEPGALGMIDGNGSSSVLEAQIKQGVAGGHETLMWEIEKLVLSATGQVEPEKTILVHRNSWTKSFGDEGNYRSHLSTWVTLGQYSDFRLLVAA